MDTHFLAQKQVYHYHDDGWMSDRLVPTHYLFLVSFVAIHVISYYHRPASNEAMRQVPLERGISIAVNGLFLVEVANQERVI